MIQMFAVISVLALAACGADGEPVQPTLTAGVSVGSGGVHPSVGVGMRKGAFHVGGSIF